MSAVAIDSTAATGIEEKIIESSLNSEIENENNNNAFGDNTDQLDFNDNHSDIENNEEEESTKIIMPTIDIRYIPKEDTISRNSLLQYIPDDSILTEPTTRCWD